MLIVMNAKSTKTSSITGYYQQILSELESINSSLGAPYLLAPVKTLLRHEHHSIDIAVIGQFKSGKSSLINHLLKTHLLPVGVVPVTAVVTILQYAKEPKLEIHFTDGFMGTAPLEDLALYVTEKQNPENIKQVQYVVVKHPDWSVLGNLRIVDTPGLGSFYKHNSEVTKRWMPFTGSALVAVSAERPLSDDDIYLLKEVSKYCPDVALVVTKVDLFGADELQNITNYISVCLRKSLGKEIPVFLFSVYSTGEEYVNELLSQVVSPYCAHTGQILHRILKHKFSTIVQQSIQYCELALYSAQKFESDKQQIAKLLDDIGHSHHYKEREMLLTVTNFKGEVRKQLEALFLPFAHEIVESLEQGFAHEYPCWKGTLSVVTHRFEHWLEEALSENISRICADNFGAINQIVGEISDYLHYTGIQFKQQLDEKLYSLFKVHLPDAYWKPDFAGVDKPDISTFRAFESHLDMLLSFLPMNAQTRAIFESHFRKQIPIETEKNIERYISVLTTKIFKTINQIHTQALRYMNEEQQSVQHILCRSENRSHEITLSLNKLKGIYDELQQV